MNVPALYLGRAFASKAGPRVPGDFPARSKISSCLSWQGDLLRCSVCSVSESSPQVGNIPHARVCPLVPCKAFKAQAAPRAGMGGAALEMTPCLKFNRWGACLSEPAQGRRTCASELVLRASCSDKGGSPMCMHGVAVVSHACSLSAAPAPRLSTLPLPPAHPSKQTEHGGRAF